MLVIELRFPTGRFHATPWGRNVNEGVAEWPPSPFRLARALIDVCLRRRPEWNDERLLAVLRTLQNPVGFSLPRARVSHTRSFLSSNATDPTKKQKILDAFVVMNPDTPLLAFFRGDAGKDTLDDLGSLLAELNYLGRSESWITATCRSQSSQEVSDMDCMVVEAADPLPPGMERIEVACLRPEDDYIATLAHDGVRTQPGKRKRQEHMPWLQAICLSTKDLLQEGWSAPPAMVVRECFRRQDTLSARSAPKRQPLRARFRVAEYALHSKVLPRVTDTIPFAERVRVKLMGIHKRVMGSDPASVSMKFSGKTPDGQADTKHRHVFILPVDKDKDGRLDHLVIWSPEPFDSAEVESLDALSSVWQSGGRPDVQLTLVSLTKNPLGPPSRRWISATPFALKRHYRKGRGEFLDWLACEVRRECACHGLPEPIRIEWTDSVCVGGRDLRWMEFVRSRKGRSALQAHGCRLTFAEPVSGPLVLGALCHFGLGLFVPVGEPDSTGS